MLDKYGEEVATIFCEYSFLNFNYEELITEIINNLMVILYVVRNGFNSIAREMVKKDSSVIFNFILYNLDKDGNYVKELGKLDKFLRDIEYDAYIDFYINLLNNSKVNSLFLNYKII